MVSDTSKSFYVVDSGVVLHEGKMSHEFSLFFTFDVCRYLVILRMDYLMPVNKVYLFYRCKVFFMYRLFVTCKTFLQIGFNNGRVQGISCRRKLECFSCFFPLENGGNEKLCCAWNHYTPRTARPLACLTKLSPVRQGYCLAGWRNSNTPCSIIYYVSFVFVFSHPFLT